MRSRSALLLALGTALALTAAACSSSDPEPAGEVTSAGSAELDSEPAASGLSIVQLGDSIASGEGTLYGYVYDATSGTWTGGNIDAPWPPPYPDCHVSPDAYGNHVSDALDADFTTFACTGATFDAGIAAPETDDGTDMRPAQFGNWTDQTDINEAYDEADPDLVLITLGADDVRFTPIVEACVKNAYEYAADLVDEECVPSNPGETVQEDFFEYLPTLEAHYRTLAEWIHERAGDGEAPKVLFTNYPNPLPPSGVECADTSYLYEEQVEYLSSLVDQLNPLIESTIADISRTYDNVGFVDLAQAYEVEGSSHRWCTDDPWAYGLSIYQWEHPSSFHSQAPFHPTPRGQERIAELVEPVARQILGLA